MAHKPGVLKSSGRPVQATGQHDGEKLQVLVLSQREASLEYFNNLFQVNYCMLFCAFRCFLNLFTMQTRERVVPVADEVGRSSRNSRVELVVPRGQVYFESEESLSKFMSNMVSIATRMHEQLHWLFMHASFFCHMQESNRSGHQASECQNGRVKLIHCRVENEFASAAELGSYVNRFCRSTSWRSACRLLCKGGMLLLFLCKRFINVSSSYLPHLWSLWFHQVYGVVLHKPISLFCFIIITTYLMLCMVCCKVSMNE